MEGSANVHLDFRAGQPLVSVIVPVFNGERFLANTLQSIYDQDYRPLEALVVDVAQLTPRPQFRARSLNSNTFINPIKAAAARNAGLENVSGELIGFLDADDLWAPHKLSSQVAYHLQHPEVDCSFVGLANFVEEGIEPPPWFRDNQSQNGGRDYSPCTLLARRSVFDRVGLFDTAYRVGEDTEWFVRAADAGVKVGFLPEILVQRRLHGANLSYESPAVRMGILMRILKASIKRKRKLRT